MTDTPYLVGKGRPPKHTQFKKGQSGNPAGGRRKTVDVAEAARRLLLRQVTVTQDGFRTKMRGVNVLIQKIFAKAVSGDLRAAELLFKVAGSGNEQRSADGPPSDDPADAALIQRFYDRYAGRQDDRREEPEDGRE